MFALCIWLEKPTLCVDMPIVLSTDHSSGSLADWLTL
jgi:hypothetical protein